MIIKLFRYFFCSKPRGYIFYAIIIDALETVILIKKFKYNKQSHSSVYLYFDYMNKEQAITWLTDIFSDYKLREVT